MKKNLKSILVCPVCKGALTSKSSIFNSKSKELICERDKLAFPVRKGVPVLLKSDARHIED